MVQCNSQKLVSEMSLVRLQVVLPCFSLVFIKNLINIKSKEHTFYYLFCIVLQDIVIWAPHSYVYNMYNL